MDRSWSPKVQINEPLSASQRPRFEYPGREVEKMEEVSERSEKKEESIIAKLEKLAGCEVECYPAASSGAMIAHLRYYPASGRFILLVLGMNMRSFYAEDVRDVKGKVIFFA